MSVWPMHADEFLPETCALIGTFLLSIDPLLTDTLFDWPDPGQRTETSFEW